MPESTKSPRSTAGANRGPSQGEAYGMGAVMQIFKGTGFPAKKDDLLKKAANHRISWTKGGDKLELADLVRRAPENEYKNMAQVVSAVSSSAKGQAKGR